MGAYKWLTLLNLARFGHSEGKLPEYVYLTGVWESGKKEEKFCSEGRSEEKFLKQEWVWKNNWCSMYTEKSRWQ